jgi:hypothetical protein
LRSGCPCTHALQMKLRPRIRVFLSPSMGRV